MGYLRQYLTEADLADISAYLATVAPAGAVELLPATWPSGEEFGEECGAGLANNQCAQHACN
jgi:hypothetical protein